VSLLNERRVQVVDRVDVPGAAATRRGFAGFGLRAFEHLRATFTGSVLIGIK
jgi:hypothetical protein